MEGYWTDKLLYYTHNKTSYPWLVNNRYKLCYSMPNYCYSKTNKEYELHKVHAPDNLSDVLQVYIAILPIHTSTYNLRSNNKWRNNVYGMQKNPIPERGPTVSENTTIVPSDTLILRYYI